MMRAESALAALAALVALTLLPAASGQPPLSGVGVEAGTLDQPLPHSGSGALPFNVTLACPEILSGGGSATVTVSAVDPPAFLTVASASVGFGPDPACLTGAGSLTKAGELTITPGPGAPGLADIPLTLVAATGSSESEPAAAMVQVAYRPGHAITPDVTFPVEVHGGPVTFNLTLEFSGNARSMVMFEEVAVQTGAVKGLRPLIQEPPSTQVLQVTFTPPDGPWVSSNVTFYNYSHYLLESGAAGGPELESRPTWTFINAEGHEEHGEDKDSPGLAAPLAALALLGLALAARRREP